MTDTNPTINAEAEKEEEIVISKESIESNKRKNKMVWCVLIAIVTILFIIGLSVLIWYITSIESEENSKSNALYEIDGIGKHLNNFTESDSDTFDHAFDVFDSNDDGSLNMEEFRILFEMQLDNASTFERMDIDNDGILSYAECVAHLKYGIGALGSWIDTLSPLIYEKYDYNHSDPSISNIDLFFEYATIMTYFEIFDTDNNGYIHKKEWLSISSQNEFIINDFDSDGEITEDEFLNIMYGTDEKSWKGLFDRSVHSSELPVINTKIVKEVQMTLNLCPTQMHEQLGQNKGYRHRLQHIGNILAINGQLYFNYCIYIGCGYNVVVGYPCYTCFEFIWHTFTYPACVTQPGDTVWLVRVWDGAYGC